MSAAAAMGQMDGLADAAAKAHAAKSSGNAAAMRVKNTFIDLCDDEADGLTIATAPAHARRKTCPDLAVPARDSEGEADLDEPQEEHHEPLAAALPASRVIVKNTFIEAEEAETQVTPRSRRYRTCPEEFGSPKRCSLDGPLALGAEDASDDDMDQDASATARAWASRRVCFQTAGSEDLALSDGEPTPRAARHCFRTEDLRESLLAGTFEQQDLTGLGGRASRYEEDGSLTPPNSRCRNTEDLREGLLGRHPGSVDLLLRGLAQPSRRSALGGAVDARDPARIATGAQKVMLPRAACGLRVSLADAVGEVGGAAVPGSPPQHHARLGYARQAAAYAALPRGAMAFVAPTSPTSPMCYRAAVLAPHSACGSSSAMPPPPPALPPQVYAAAPGWPSMLPYQGPPAARGSLQPYWPTGAAGAAYGWPPGPGLGNLAHAPMPAPFHFPGAPAVTPAVPRTTHAAAQLEAAAAEADFDVSPAPHRAPRGPTRRLRLWAHIYLHMQVPGFDLVPRLIGRGGKNMRRIADETGAKLRIRGRGSGHLEIEGKREAPTPLMVAVTTDKCDENAFRNAIAMTLTALRTAESDFHVFCERMGIQHEGPCYSVGLLPDHGREVLADILQGVPQSAVARGQR